MAKKPLPIDPAIKHRADEILRKSGCPRLSNGIAVDIQKIIEEFCRFKFALVPNLELNGKARLAAFIPQHDYILVEEHCIEPRQRFSMAHELGHASLEHDYGPADSLFASMGQEAFLCGEDDLGASENSEIRVGRRRRSEIRANQFASFILMPEALVREVWRNRRDDSYCASDLGVSAEALGYRLQQLGLVTSGSIGR